jgi:RHS repeat-associated protein
LGAVIQKRAYGTYGETNPSQMTLQPNATTIHPFGYTGRRWDPDLGLYYYRARWYDPQLGTFLETDPIGSLDYVNLYAYVGAEPGNGVDPTGMQVVTIGGGGESNSRGSYPLSSPIMRDFSDSYSRAHPDRRTMYFGHAEARSRALNEIVKYRNKLADEGVSQPLNIIGLSWGASEAIKLTADLYRAGIKVDTLTTLDPVGEPGWNTGAALLGSGFWQNVHSHSQSDQMGDRVAEWWGRSVYAQDAADLSITVMNTHTDVIGMMAARGGDGQTIAERIEATYRRGN